MALLLLIQSKSEIRIPQSEIIGRDSTLCVKTQSHQHIPQVILNTLYHSHSPISCPMRWIISFFMMNPICVLNDHPILRSLSCMDDQIGRASDAPGGPKATEGLRSQSVSSRFRVHSCYISKQHQTYKIHYRA